MTPEQALQVLQIAAQKAPMIKNDHDICAQAVKILAEILQKIKEPKQEIEEVK